jgi:hydroxycarboxylate dehydrogenase B
VLKIHPVRAEQKVAQLFVACGVKDSEAELVAAELMRAELMGVRSHGLIRVPQYLEDIESGLVRLDASVEVVNSSGGTVIVDCGRALGIVAAHRVLDIAMETARSLGIAAVVTQNCNHVGRLAAYVERAANAGFVSIATAVVPRFAHIVVPWGGMDGRLGTNPFAFGFPTDGDPIVADFATSVIPEGRVRSALMAGSSLPSDAVLDAEGDVTTDPVQFYGPPRGMLLPFGGAVGYKGYALGLLAQLLGGTLAGTPVEQEDAPVNGLFFMLLDTAGLLPEMRARELASDVVRYMRSSRPAPGFEHVLVPGEAEFARLTETTGRGFVEVSDPLWSELSDLGKRLDVDLSSAVLGWDGDQPV